MKCSEFKAALDERLDLRLSLTADPLTEHAAACPACRELQHEYGVLADAIAALRLPLPSPDLPRRVLVAARSAPWAAPPVRLSPFRRLQPALTLATAATALLATILSLHQDPRPSSRPTFATARPPGPTSQPALTTVPSSPFAESPGVWFAQAGNAYFDLARRTAQSLGEARVLVSSPAALPTAVPIPKDLKSPAVEWIDELGAEIRPLATTTTRAFDFLLVLSPRSTAPEPPVPGRSKNSAPPPAAAPSSG